MNDPGFEAGLSGPTAEAVAREVHADPELALRAPINRELGVTLGEEPSAWTAALSSFAAFAVGMLIGVTAA